MLSPHGCRIFAEAGWQEVLDDPSVVRLCLGVRRRWAGAARETEDFFLQPGGPGRIAARARLDGMMLGLARRAGAGARIGRVAGAYRHGDRIEVAVATSSGAERLSGDLVIDASGRRASVARRLGARRVTEARQAAWRLPGTRRTSPGGGAWIDISGCPGDWEYELDGHDGEPERVRICRSRPPGAGANALDASSAWLDRAAGEGWVAVGDAAVSCDPIAGQGLGLAVASAAAVAGAILADRVAPQGRFQEYSSRLAATRRYYSQARKKLLQGAASPGAHPRPGGPGTDGAGNHPQPALSCGAGVSGRGDGA